MDSNPNRSMKTAQPIKTTELTEEETHRLAYMRLVLKSLEECKGESDSQSLSFSREEKKVIEYHLKDVARHAVKEHTSQDEYVAIFQGRIERLTSGDESEWGRINDLITRNREILEQTDKKSFKDIIWYFLRKDTEIES